MTCDECFEAFSGAVDGAIDSEEREAMTVHLEECVDCRHLQTRMLALSAEMKVQPFPEPRPERLKEVVHAALAGAQNTGWGRVRRLLRAPYEQWGLRTSLRLASFSGIGLLSVLYVITRWLLPVYDGLETVAKRGLPSAQNWAAWTPPSTLLTWAPLLVLLVGLWTCGLPGLFLDLNNKTRLAPRDLVFLALGLALLGPVAGLPLLAKLEIGTYLLLCCLWTGLCLGGGFALAAFQTQRPLPRLALDFVALILPLGALEWCARSSLSLPGPEECQNGIALLVGSVSFPTLIQGFILLLGSSLLLWSGLVGLLPSYRSSGGRWFAGLLLLSGLSVFSYGVSRIPSSWQLFSPVRAKLADPTRGAYILASSQDNPWLLSRTDYPRLEIDENGSTGGARSARLRLAAAYLNWDESALLNTLNDWADNAPGVTWGLSAFVDSLGRRNGSVIALPSEARQKTVAHLLLELRWRVLAEAVLSSERGSVKGRIEGLNGQREGLKVRLLPVGGAQPLSGAEKGLVDEVNWARTLLGDDDLEATSAPPEQRTVLTDSAGDFAFDRVADGTYALAVLLEQPIELTYNSTIPGIFEIVDGRPTRLDPITLSAGREGDGISLEASKWQSQGGVEFTPSADGPQIDLSVGASITGFVDSQTFHGGRARVKLWTSGPPKGSGLLLVKFFTKEGRLHRELSQEFSASGLHEVVISSQGREGYLQLTLLSVESRLTVKGIKLEVLANE